HFGSLSDFALAVRYDGGSVREDQLGSVPLLEGVSFHNTALYEFGYLLVLFAVLHWLIRRTSPPGTVLGVFCVVYGIARFLTDFLRVNDETVLGLTGAQWLCLALIPAGVWVMRRAQGRTTAEPESEPEPGEVDSDAAAETEGDEANRESEPGAEREPGDEPEPAVESTES
ncbi:MAG: prolipoprotein diacylglyceryl transferase, partial [Acidimicrobiales bacterium]